MFVDIKIYFQIPTKSVYRFACGYDPPGGYDDQWSGDGLLKTTTSRPTIGRQRALQWEFYFNVKSEPRVR